MNVRSADNHPASAPTGITGRRLSFARAAWVVLAFIVLGLNAVGIPYAYDEKKRLLTAEGAERLRELGLPPEVYAAYMGVGLQIFVTLFFLVVAGVIFARRSGDRMALFAAFMLLLFGGAAASGTMESLPEARSGFWLPVNLLDYLGQVSFGVFFCLLLWRSKPRRRAVRGCWRRFL